MYLEINQQVEDLFNLEVNIDSYTFDISGSFLPVRFTSLKTSKLLLVGFHAALDRRSNHPPSFAPFQVIGNVAQLMFSDPSILKNELSTSWYTGHNGFDAQKIISKILHSVIQHGNYDRIVFFGASAGGFASLYFSSLFEGSVAVVLQPQTDLKAYLTYQTTHNYYDSFASTLYPGENSALDWANKSCIDLCDWYSTQRENSIIYIQSSGDYPHVKMQMTPFLSAISKTGAWNLILATGYWGELGHSPIPSEYYYTWLKAAFSSPSVHINDILSTYWMLSNNAKVEPNYLVHDPVIINSKEYFLNNLLNDYLLRFA